MSSFSFQCFQKQFPLLERNNNLINLVYFDNAATSQKPLCVIEKYQTYYKQYNANVHRASHQLSSKATLEFEVARRLTKNFINAVSEKEIIWTKGTTESINLIAQSWGLENLKSGDEIVLSYGEHHANIVPWQIIAQKVGAIIKVLPLSGDGLIDEQQIDKLITAKTKLVSCAHISNVLGVINPIEKIINRAKQVGAITIIDGAQAIAHLPIDVQKLDCDFYVFSAHKMYGPTGVGVLYGKASLLSKMPPYQSGGEMINKVSFAGTTFNELPFKFEAGTPNIAGVIAFGQCLSFINGFDSQQLTQYENELTAYCYEKLTEIKQVVMITEGKPDIPLFSFRIKSHHNHDVASALDSFGIALRSGHHCAMPLMEYLNIDGCLRVSLAPYNTYQEIDFFIEKLNGIIKQTPICQDKTITLQSAKKSDLTQEIITLFEQCKGWDARHRQIMLLGKNLPPSNDKLRIENNLIHGCESSAWLCSIQAKDGTFTFTADSNAKIIKGLLVIVLAAFNDKTAEQIKAFNLKDYFEKLGLMKHLSPSRGNGLQAIVDNIYKTVS